ncbi:MAG: SDR family NAD(P)-dependent oxidoreductase [Acidimicrobiales bacterium]
MDTAQTPLHDAVIVITGSTSGIGRAMALELSTLGASIVVNSSNHHDEGQRLASELPHSLYVGGSITEEGFASHFIEEVIHHYGRLDVLINNAATTKVIPHRDLLQADRATWRTIFETNVFATFDLITHAAPHLKDSKGQILNVASLAGLRPTGSSIPYAASKAALIHVTTLLAAALAPEVRVNAVAPGLVDTPWTEDWDAVRAQYQRTAPLQRSATPEDVSHLVTALIQTPYLTGAIVPLDGGMGLVR